jgi:hypothetical protein
MLKGVGNPIALMHSHSGATARFRRYRFARYRFSHYRFRRYRFDQAYPPTLTNQ